MTYRTGHLRDPAHLVAKRIGFHAHPKIGAMRAGTLPLATANRSKLAAAKGGPGILDQHDTSSCEGHAHASGVTLRMALAGTPLPEVVSPVGLYYGALMNDRMPNADGSLPALMDSGTMPSSILSGMQLWGGSGASVWGQYPASSQTMYINPSDPNSPLINPTVNQLAAERAFRLNGAYFIQSTGHGKAIDLMTALAAGYPVSDAIPASGPEFQGYKGGIIGELSGDVDHANLIVDYDWIGTQAQLDGFIAGDDSLWPLLVVHCVNSWGEGWGEADTMATVGGGTYRGNDAYVQQAEDLCVLDIVRVS